MGECSSKDWPRGKKFMKKKLTRAEAEALLSNSEALTPSEAATAAAAIMAAMEESAGEEVWNYDQHTDTTEVDQWDVMVVSTITDEHDLDEDGTASLSCIIATSKLGEGKYDHSMTRGGASASMHPGSSSESFEYVQHSDACFPKKETELMMPTTLAQSTVLINHTCTAQLGLPTRDEEGYEQVHFQNTCINMAEMLHTSRESTTINIKREIGHAEDPFIQAVHVSSSPKKECKDESNPLTQSSVISDARNLTDEGKGILTNTALENISKEKDPSEMPSQTVVQNAMNSEQIMGEKQIFKKLTISTMQQIKNQELGETSSNATILSNVAGQSFQVETPTLVKPSKELTLKEVVTPNWNSSTLDNMQKLETSNAMTEHDVKKQLNSAANSVRNAQTTPSESGGMSTIPAMQESADEERISNLKQSFTIDAQWKTLETLKAVPGIFLKEELENATAVQKIDQVSVIEKVNTHTEVDPSTLLETENQHITLETSPKLKFPSAVEEQFAPITSEGTQTRKINQTKQNLHSVSAQEQTQQTTLNNSASAIWGSVIDNDVAALLTEAVPVSEEGLNLSNIQRKLEPVNEAGGEVSLQIQLYKTQPQEQREKTTHEGIIQEAITLTESSVTYQTEDIIEKILTEEDAVSHIAYMGEEKLNAENKKDMFWSMGIATEQNEELDLTHKSGLTTDFPQEILQPQIPLIKKDIKTGFKDTETTVQKKSSATNDVVCPIQEMGVHIDLTLAVGTKNVHAGIQISQEFDNPTKMQEQLIESQDYKLTANNQIQPEVLNGIEIHECVQTQRHGMGHSQALTEATHVERPLVIQDTFAEAEASVSYQDHTLIETAMNREVVMMHMPSTFENGLKEECKEDDFNMKASFQHKPPQKSEAQVITVQQKQGLQEMETFVLHSEVAEHQQEIVMDTLDVLQEIKFAPATQEQETDATAPETGKKVPLSIMAMQTTTGTKIAATCESFETEMQQPAQAMYQTRDAVNVGEIIQQDAITFAKTQKSSQTDSVLEEVVLQNVATAEEVSICHQQPTINTLPHRLDSTIKVSNKRLAKESQDTPAAARENHANTKAVLASQNDQTLQSKIPASDKAPADQGMKEHVRNDSIVLQRKEDTVIATETVEGIIETSPSFESPTITHETLPLMAEEDRSEGTRDPNQHASTGAWEKSTCQRATAYETLAILHDAGQPQQSAGIKLDDGTWAIQDMHNLQTNSEVTCITVQQEHATRNKAISILEGKVVTESAQEMFCALPQFELPNEMQEQPSVFLDKEMKRMPKHIAQLAQHTKATVIENFVPQDETDIAYITAETDSDNLHKMIETSSKFAKRTKYNLIGQKVTEASTDQIQQDKLNEESMQHASKSQKAKASEILESFKMVDKVFLQGGFETQMESPHIALQTQVEQEAQAQQLTQEIIQQGISDVQEAVMLIDQVSNDSNKLNLPGNFPEVERSEDISRSDMELIIWNDQAAIQKMKAATNKGLQGMPKCAAQLVEQTQAAVDKSSSAIHDASVTDQAAAANENNSGQEILKDSSEFKLSCRTQDILMAPKKKVAKTNQIQQDNLEEKIPQQASQILTAQHTEFSQMVSKAYLQEESETQTIFTHEVLQSQPKGAQSQKLPEVINSQSRSDVQHSFVVNVAVGMGHATAAAESDRLPDTPRASSSCKFPFEVPQYMERAETDEPNRQRLQEASQCLTEATSEGSETPFLQAEYETHIAETHKILQIQTEREAQPQQLPEEMTAQGVWITQEAVIMSDASTSEAGIMSEASTLEAGLMSEASTSEAVIMPQTSTAHETDKIHYPPRNLEVGEVQTCKTDLIVTIAAEALQSAEPSGNNDLPVISANEAQLMQQTEAFVGNSTSVHDAVVKAHGNAVIEGDIEDISPKKPSKIEFPIEPQEYLLVQEKKAADITQVEQEKLNETSLQRTSNFQIAKTSENLEDFKMETNQISQDGSKTRSPATHKTLLPKLQDEARSHIFTESTTRDGTSNVQDEVTLKEASTLHKMEKLYQAAAIPVVKLLEESSICKTELIVTNDPEAPETMKTVTNNSLQGLPESADHTIDKPEATGNGDKTSPHDAIDIGHTAAAAESDRLCETLGASSSCIFPFQIPQYILTVQEIKEAEIENPNKERLQQVLQCLTEATSENSESPLQVNSETHIAATHNILQFQMVRGTQPQQLPEEMAPRGIGTAQEALIISEAHTSEVVMSDASTSEALIMSEASTAHETDKVYHAARNLEVEKLQTCRTDLIITAAEETIQTAKPSSNNSLPEMPANEALLLQQTEAFVSNMTSVHDTVVKAQGDTEIEEDSKDKSPTEPSKFPTEPSDYLPAQKIKAADISQVQQEKLNETSLQSAYKFQIAESSENQEDCKIETNQISQGASKTQFIATHKILHSQLEDEARSHIVTESIIWEGTSNVQDEVTLKEASTLHETKKLNQAAALGVVKPPEEISTHKTKRVLTNDPEAPETMTTVSNNSLQEPSESADQTAEKAEATENRNEMFPQDRIAMGHTSAAAENDRSCDTPGASSSCKLQALQCLSAATSEDSETPSLQVEYETRIAAIHDILQIQTERRAQPQQLPQEMTPQSIWTIHEAVIMSETCTSEVVIMPEASTSEVTMAGAFTSEATIVPEASTVHETDKTHNAARDLEVGKVPTCRTDLIIATAEEALLPAKPLGNNGLPDMPGNEAQLVQQTESFVSNTTSAHDPIAKVHADSAIKRGSEHKSPKDPSKFEFPIEPQDFLLGQEIEVTDVSQVEQEKLNEHSLQSASNFQIAETSKNLEDFKMISQEGSKTQIAATHKTLHAQLEDEGRPHIFTESITYEGISNAQDEDTLKEASALFVTEKLNQAATIPVVKLPAEISAHNTEIIVTNDPDVPKTIKLVKINSLQELSQGADQGAEKAEATEDANETFPWNAICMGHTAAATESDSSHETPSASSSCKFPFHIPQHILTVQEMKEADTDKPNEESLQQASQRLTEATCEKLEIPSLQLEVETQVVKTHNILQIQTERGAQPQQLPEQMTPQDIWMVQEAYIISEAYSSEAGIMSEPSTSEAVIMSEASTGHEAGKGYHAARNLEVGQVQICRTDLITTTAEEALPTAKPSGNNGLPDMPTNEAQLMQQTETFASNTTAIPDAVGKAPGDAAIKRENGNKSLKDDSKFEFLIEPRDYLPVQEIRPADVYQVKHKKVDENSLQRASKFMIAESSENLEDVKMETNQILQEQSNTQIAATHETVHTQLEYEARSRILTESIIHEEASNVQDEVALKEALTLHETQKSDQIAAIPVVNLPEEISICKTEPFVISDSQVTETMKMATNISLQELAESADQRAEKAEAAKDENDTLPCNAIDMGHTAAAAENDKSHETPGASLNCKCPCQIPQYTLTVQEIKGADTHKPNKESLQEASQCLTEVTFENSEAPPLQVEYETQIAATHNILQFHSERRAQPQQLPEEMTPQDIWTIQEAVITSEVSTSRAVIMSEAATSEAATMSEASTAHESDKIYHAASNLDIGEGQTCRTDLIIATAKEALQTAKPSGNNSLPDMPANEAQLAEQTEAFISNTTSVRGPVAKAHCDIAIERDSGDKSPKDSSNLEFPIESQYYLLVQEIKATDINQVEQEKLDENSPHSTSKSQIAKTSEKLEDFKTKDNKALHEGSKTQIAATDETLHTQLEDEAQSHIFTESIIHKGASNVQDEITLKESPTLYETEKINQAADVPMIKLPEEILTHTTNDPEVPETIKMVINNSWQEFLDSADEPSQKAEATKTGDETFLHDAVDMGHTAGEAESGRSDGTQGASSSCKFPVQTPQYILIVQETKGADTDKPNEESLQQASQCLPEATSENSKIPSFQVECENQTAATRNIFHQTEKGDQPQQLPEEMTLQEIQEGVITKEASTMHKTDKIYHAARNIEVGEVQGCRMDLIITTAEEALQTAKPSGNNHLPDMPANEAQLVEETEVIVNKTISTLQDAVTAHAASAKESVCQHEIPTAYIPRLQDFIEEEKNQIRQEEFNSKTLQQALEPNIAATSNNLEASGMVSKLSVQDELKAQITDTHNENKSQTEKEVKHQQLTEVIIQQSISNVHNAGILRGLTWDETGRITQPAANQEIKVPKELPACKMNAIVTTDWKALQSMKLATNEGLPEMSDGSAPPSTTFNLVSKMSLQEESGTQIAFTPDILQTLLVERARPQQLAETIIQESASNVQDAVMVTNPSSSHETDKINFAVPISEVETSKEVLTFEMDIMTDQEALPIIKPTSNGLGGTKNNVSQMVQQTKAFIDEEALVLHDAVMVAHVDAAVEGESRHKTPGGSTKLQFPTEEEHVLTLREMEKLESDQSEKEKLDQERLLQASNSQTAESSGDLEILEMLGEISLQEESSTQIAPVHEVLQAWPEDTHLQQLTKSIIKQVISNAQDEVILTGDLASHETRIILQATENPDVEVSDKAQLCRKESIIPDDQEVFQNVRLATNEDFHIISNSPIQLVQRTETTTKDITSALDETIAIVHAAATIESNTGDEARVAFSKFQFQITAQDILTVQDMKEAEADQIQQDKLDGESLRQPLQSQIVGTSQTLKMLETLNKPCLQEQLATDNSATYKVTQSEPGDETLTISNAQNEIGLIEASKSDEIGKMNHTSEIPKLEVSEENSICEADIITANYQEMLPIMTATRNKESLGVSNGTAQEVQQTQANTDQTQQKKPNVGVLQQAFKHHIASTSQKLTDSKSTMQEVSKTRVLSVHEAMQTQPEDGDQSQQLTGAILQQCISKEKNASILTETFNSHKMDNIAGAIPKEFEVPKKESNCEINLTITADQKVLQAIKSETSEHLQRTYQSTAQLGHQTASTANNSMSVHGIDMGHGAAQFEQNSADTSTKASSELEFPIRSQDKLVLQEMAEADIDSNKQEKHDEKSLQKTPESQTVVAFEILEALATKLPSQEESKTLTAAPDKALQILAEDRSQSQQLTKAVMQQGTLTTQSAVILSQASIPHDTIKQSQATTNPEVEGVSTCMTDLIITTDEEVLQTTKSTTNECSKEMPENEAQLLQQCENIVNKTMSTLHDAVTALAPSAVVHVVGHKASGVSSMLEFPCKTQHIPAAQNILEAEENQINLQGLDNESLQQALKLHIASGCENAEAQKIVNTLPLQEETEAQDTTTPKQIKSPPEEAQRQRLVETIIQQGTSNLQDAVTLRDFSSLHEIDKITQPPTDQESELCKETPTYKMDLIMATSQEPLQIMNPTIGKGLWDMSESAAQLLQRTKVTLNKTASVPCKAISINHAASATGALSMLEIPIQTKDSLMITGMTEADVGRIQKEKDQNQQLIEAMKHQGISDTQDAVNLTMSSISPEKNNVNWAAANPNFAVSQEISTSAMDLILRTDQENSKFQVAVSEQIPSMALLDREKRQTNQIQVETPRKIIAEETMPSQIAETRQTLQTEIQEGQIRQLIEAAEKHYEQAKENKGESVLNGTVILCKEKPTSKINTVACIVSTFQEEPTVYTQEEKEATSTYLNLEVPDAFSAIQQEETATGENMAGLGDAATLPHNGPLLDIAILHKTMETTAEF